MSTSIDFPSYVDKKLEKKKEPNLWHPPSLDHSQRPIFNTANMQSLISAIFQKVGRDKFNLQPHEFEVTLQLDLGDIRYRVLGGIRVLILWNVIPKVQDGFNEDMMYCLSKVRDMRHPVAIERVVRLDEYRKQVPDYEHLKGVPANECDVELYRLAKVIHKKTGLVSIQYHREEKGITWTKLAAEGRFEIRQGIEAIQGKTNETQAKTS